MYVCSCLLSNGIAGDVIDDLMDWRDRPGVGTC